MQKDDFELEEFKSLRIEIMEHLSAQKNLEIACVIAMAVMYSFLLTGGSQLPWLAWLIPPVIAAFGLIRILAYYAELSNIADYLRINEKLLNPAHGYWEHFIHNKRRTEYKARLTGLTFLFSFAVLFFGSLFIAWGAYIRFYTNSSFVSQS